MQKLKFKSLLDFVNHYGFANIDKETLFILDIDGVFFKNILDPREIIGIISSSNLSAFREILKLKPACWIFSNRPAIFKYFPFINQLAKTIKRITGVRPPIYSNCSEFLSSRSKDFIIILNAKKPNTESQNVVRKGLDLFSSVTYISARDFPFYFTDQELTKELGKNINLDRLTFVEISPWAKDSRSQ